MARIIKSVNIQAQRKIIWTILTKHLEHPEYAEGTASGSALRGVGGVPLTDRRVGLGVRTRWTYEFKGRPYTWDDEVTTWEEGKLIAWKAISNWKMLDSFELTSKGATTHVVYRMEYKFPYGPIGWLLARFIYHKHMERSIDQTLQTLKSSAEAIGRLKHNELQLQ